MAKRPRVVVTGDARRLSPGWWCTWLALRLAGAIPERISVKHKFSGNKPDAMIISGGSDISPEHYGGDLDAKVKKDPDRDKLEIDWINKALDWNLPLLGICRGAQLINVVLGGDLHQDIRPMRIYTYNRPGLLATKEVRLEPNSVLAKSIGKTHIQVNSLHHQAINNTGKDLKAVGRDLDNFVQAIECSVGRNIIGVQWHPEYLFYLPSHFSLFRWLLKSAKT